MYLAPLIFSPIVILSGILIIVFRDKFLNNARYTNKNIYGNTGERLADHANTRKVSIVGLILICFGIAMAVYGLIGR